jgi:hypothetical protein
MREELELGNCHGAVAEERFELVPPVISIFMKRVYHFAGKGHQFYLESEWIFTSHL